MRTTIRLADKNRASLLRIAHDRGSRSLSHIVEEAVAFYLAERNRPEPAPVVVEAPAPPGRWQRLGANLDQAVGADDSPLSLLRLLVRRGLDRLPVLRGLS